ncbi:MgtC/SapB family protein [Stutzerimonas nosocomialis]|uniref:Protein MgtC n=1 Tax=Stutzerimonas nosocomialis TaxID=1056496 RepID=A0A5R9QJR0_9GAMM|nr:MgtC/SapB family protein [Stutzerimonas nosocomialis]TLX57542.1 MgtC/SapB family protein [Stutzerimonas nosocomialis]TLX60390.1 MgtC/SapB family protein [Stutzerimonas nosocomialis]TLX65586.1 MgtC/SapB family protein [Stutzerimonas nosocomialis]
MTYWERIVSTLASEFSDIPDVEEATRVVTRLTFAAVLGGLVGYERERKGKAAGLRTHMLVSLGSALFVLTALQGGVPRDDVSRIIQGIVTGIGFLGAGTILKGSTIQEVQGLTTAAGIWLTAAIGVAAGLGNEATAVFSTLLALAVFILMPGLERHAARRAGRRRKRRRGREEAP